MDLPRNSTSVWPGYVAAVSSLVLSLLLLAGVLVVSISQAGRVVDAYNNQLITAVILDEQREQELARLRQTATDTPVKSLKPPAQNRPAVVAPRPAPETITLESLSALERLVQEKSDDYAKAQKELLRLQMESRQQAASAKEAESVKLYRLVFAAGSEGMDNTMLSQLRQQLQRDGALNSKEQWFLESGIKGLDAVAERETYRLMLRVRSQLQTVGVASDQVKVLMKRDLTMQEVHGTKSSLRSGDITIILRRQFQKAGT